MFTLATNDTKIDRLHSKINKNKTISFDGHLDKRGTKYVEDFVPSFRSVYEYYCSQICIYSFEISEIHCRYRLEVT